MPHTLTHALTWVACLTLALVVNHYVQRWLSDDDAEPDDAEPDAAPPVVAPVASPSTRGRAFPDLTPSTPRLTTPAARLGERATPARSVALPVARSVGAPLVRRVDGRSGRL